MVLKSSMGDMVNDREVRDLLEMTLEEYAERHTEPNLMAAPIWAVLAKTLARRGAMTQAMTVTKFLRPFIEKTDWPLANSYWQMLQGELLLADGSHGEALALFKQALATQETFQIHESLAEVFERQGDIAAAIEENEWLIAHRGRALVDTRLATVTIQSVIDWNRAWEDRRRLAQLLPP